MIKVTKPKKGISYYQIIDSDFPSPMWLTLKEAEQLYKKLGSILKISTIEHCGDKNCPECNKEAYNAGYKAGKDYWKREMEEDKKKYL